MRVARTTLTALLFGGALTVATAARALPVGMQPATFGAIGVAVQGSIGAVGVDFFYRDLAPYGYWVERPNYGWVWLPRHVRHHWRPYTAGHWVYTDYGTTWVSTESFGWATYHYGRWYDDPDYGWGWVPGTEWGPSWVSWQKGQGYVGWAPLPPQVGWNASAGLALGGFDLSAGLAPTHYCFVPERSFLSADVGAYALPVERNFDIVRNTTNITSYGVDNGRIIDRSLPVQQAEQITGQPVRQYQLAAMSRGTDPRIAQVSGNTVALFRPATVVRRDNAPDPRHVVPQAVATSAVLARQAVTHRAEAAQMKAVQARVAPQAPGRQQQAQGSALANGRQLRPQDQATGRTASSRVAAGTAQPTSARAMRGQPSQQVRGQQSQQLTRGQQQAQARRLSAQGQRGQQQVAGRQSVQAQRAQRAQQGQAQARRALASPSSQRYQPSTASRRQATQPPQRYQQQAARRQAAPQPQRYQQPAAGRQAPPPPQRYQQPAASRQSAPPPQRPQQQPRAQRQAPPPPQRQAQARPQPPPRPQQPARQPGQPRRQPPPNTGG